MVKKGNKYNLRNGKNGKQVPMEQTVQEEEVEETSIKTPLFIHEQSLLLQNNLIVKLLNDEVQVNEYALRDIISTNANDVVHDESYFTKIKDKLAPELFDYQPYINEKTLFIGKPKKNVESKYGGLNATFIKRLVIFQSNIKKTICVVLILVHGVFYICTLHIKVRMFKMM